MAIVDKLKSIGGSGQTIEEALSGATAALKSYTVNAIANEDGSSFTLDKTYNDILSHARNGEKVVFHYDGEVKSGKMTSFVFINSELSLAQYNGTYYSASFGSNVAAIGYTADSPMEIMISIA